MPIRPNPGALSSRRKPQAVWIRLEDWGRMDAIEVLDHAMKALNPDSSRIYLTGHSMGGHGAWQIGATFRSFLRPSDQAPGGSASTHTPAVSGLRIPTPVQDI